MQNGKQPTRHSQGHCFPRTWALPPRRATSQRGRELLGFVWCKHQPSPQRLQARHTEAVLRYTAFSRTVRRRKPCSCLTGAPGHQNVGLCDAGLALGLLWASCASPGEGREGRSCPPRTPGKGPTCPWCVFHASTSQVLKMCPWQQQKGMFEKNKMK